MLELIQSLRLELGLHHRQQVEEVIRLADLPVLHEATVQVDQEVQEVTLRVDHLVALEVEAIRLADLAVLLGAIRLADQVHLHGVTHRADQVHLLEVVDQAQEAVLQGETRIKLKRTILNGWGLTNFPPIFMPLSQPKFVPSQ